uniref:RdRp n=1 Tax=Hubei partiti-like virus 17 TaxID=1923023 RepID=A0A1L3KLP1_9VIRU|nr:RdRp [Hubei partiti-like virus 17]
MDSRKGHPNNFTYELGIAKTEIVQHGRKHAIRHPEFPGRPEHKSDLDHSLARRTGLELELRSGFGFNMEPPYPSFKTLRAAYNAGLGEIAEYVIRTKKRSWITNDAIWDGVLKFSYPTVKTHDCTVYRTVLRQLEKEFDIATKIPLVDYETSKRRMPQNTSPGLPYIQMKGFKTKGDVLDQDFKDFVEKWERVGDGHSIDIPACAAFARSHIGNLDTNKVRPVWAVPVEVILQEGIFAYPIIDELTSQRIGKHTAYGMEMMKGGMEWLNGQVLNYRTKHPGAQFLLTDYSAFDSSVPAWLIRDCFRILEKKIDFSKMQTPDGVKACNPIREKRKFWKIVSYFINTVITNPDGRTYKKDHGVPSGSMFTNIIDTMVNFIVTRVSVRYKCGIYPTFDVYFGDDSIVGFPSNILINLDDIADFAKRIFGMSINPTKSYYTDNHKNIHFLGYYNQNGTPKKTDVDLFASMLYPQYNKDEWSYSLSRALGCLLASAGANPNIFCICRTLFHMALNSKPGEAEVDAAITMIQTNPRMRRHLDTMGCGEIPLSRDFFTDYKMSVPASNCVKIMKAINLV